MAGEKCDGCGFVWDDVSWQHIPSLLRATAHEMVAELVQQESNWTRRPSDQRWSTREYACHVRDVLLSLRERLILASVLDHPTGTAIYRDDRIRIGLYANENVSDVVNDLVMAADLAARTIAVLPNGFDGRTMTYSAQTPADVTLQWVAAQGLHEVVHHLGDIRENARLG